MLHMKLPAVKINHYIFKPSLIPTMVTIVFLYTMISLGFWQLDRAEYKANLQTIIDSRIDQSPVPFDEVSRDGESWLFQPVMLSGNYDFNKQLLLDNQVNNTRAGYGVFTPFKLENNQYILINRGWLPVGKDRRQLPDISMPDMSKSVHISGVLSPVPAKGLVLSDNANNYNSWPVLLQYIDIDEIQQKTGYRLLPMVLVLEAEPESKLQPLPYSISVRSEKHTAYAFQWFALSLALIIIYIVVNVKRMDKTVR